MTPLLKVGVGGPIQITVPAGSAAAVSFVSRISIGPGVGTPSGGMNIMQPSCCHAAVGIAAAPVAGAVAPVPSCGAPAAGPAGWGVVDLSCLSREGLS